MILKVKGDLMSDNCCCGNKATTLIYSCSGAANTGFLADSTARKLMKENKGKMCCLSAVGAGKSGHILSANAADKNIVIDGCNVKCGKTIFEKHKLPFEHFIVTDFGIEKGKTEITTEVIDDFTEKIAKQIG